MFVGVREVTVHAPEKPAVLIGYEFGKCEDQSQKKSPAFPRG